MVEDITGCNIAHALARRMNAGLLKDKADDADKKMVVTSFEEMLALEALGVDIVSSKDADGNTPLHCAAEVLNVELVSFLLKRGADSNVRNNTGLTAAEMAVRGRLPVNSDYPLNELNL